MPRYQVAISVELEVDANDQAHARGKAVRWVGASHNSQVPMPDGITQLTLWVVECIDAEDTPPEREDEDKR